MLCISYKKYKINKRPVEKNDNIEYNILQQSNNHIKLGGSVKEMSRAGPKKGAQNQPCQPRSFQGMSEKEEKFKQNQVQ